MTLLDSTFWWHLVRTATIDVCCLAALALAAHRFMRRAVWQRAVWQITVICLLLLPASEWTGFGNATAKFLFGKKQIAPSAAAEYVSPIPQSHMVQQKLILPPPPARRTIWWPSWVWACGLAIVLGRMATAQVLLVALRLRRQKIASQSLRERVLRVATSVGLRRKIYLIWMPEAICPMAFGIFRPSIGLPPAFETKFSAAEQEAILAHELAHLEARDPMWFRLADFASALLWWHPLSWYVRRMLHSTSEMAADEATAIVPDGAEALASCLITLGKEMTASHGWGWVGINGGFRSELGKRVKRLMQISVPPKRPPGGWTAAFAKTAAAILVVPSVVLLFGSFQSAQGQKEESWRGQLRDSWDTSPGAILVMAALDDKEKQHADIALRIQNAKLLYETGKLDEAKAILLQVLRDDPANPTAPYYLDLIKADREAEGWEPVPITRNVPTNAIFTAAGRENIISKLNRIRLSEVRYDLPLAEVLNQLRVESQKNDPAGIGINFMINPVNSAVDMNTVRIKIDHSLTNVRMADVLEAISKAASQPIYFSIEDYAVVFKPMVLYTKTFKVEPINFVQNLNAVCGTNASTTDSPVFKGKELAAPYQPGAQVHFSYVTKTNKTAELHRMVMAYFTAAGVDFTYTGKSVFFNDRTGLILVRATLEDLAIIEQAVATLNQSPPQVLITAQMADANDAIVKQLMPDWTNSQTIATRIITEGERELALTAIERTDEDVLGFPKGSTLSGRKIRLGSGDNLSLELFPIVQADGFSINTTATLSTKIGGETKTWNIDAFRDVPDGATLEAFIPPQSPGAKPQMVFITPRIIDAAGNTVHSDTEISNGH